MQDTGIMQDTGGIYIHWPYCLSKCPYCDFNSYTGQKADDELWIRAYQIWLRNHKDWLESRDLKSVFFGGGTPSLMDPRIVESVLIEIEQLSGQTPKEVTLEANPTSSEKDKFSDFASAGVNRLSLGVQALDDMALKFLGREHSASDALDALQMARTVFDNVSFDLIYARPGQSLSQWKKELDRALSYKPSHMSLYQLTIEPGTAFYQKHKRGDFQMPDDEYQAELYDLTTDLTTDHGLESYEVSNYARPGRESEHNLIYWRGDEYLGIGPGAHGRLKNLQNWVATRQHSAPDIWLERTHSNIRNAEKTFCLTATQRAEEILMMSLRLKNGVDLHDFQEKTNLSVKELIDTGALKTLVNEGYVQQSDQAIAVTKQGRLVLDSVIGYLLRSGAEYSVI